MFCPECGNFAANKAICKLQESGQVGRVESKVIFPSTKLEIVPDESGSGMYMHAFDTPPFVLVEGQKYKVAWNGTAYECVACVVEGTDLPMMCLGNCSLANTDEIILPNTGEPFMFVYVNVPGLVEMMSVGTPEAITTATLSVSTETIHPIDLKYLPSEVAKVGTAAVGQTIVVKTVDENGKPTEWETADMGGGSGGGLPVVEINTVLPNSSMDVSLTAEEGALLDDAFAKNMPTIIRFKYKVLDTENEVGTSAMVFAGRSQAGIIMFQYGLGDLYVIFGSMGEGWTGTCLF